MEIGKRAAFRAGGPDAYAKQYWGEIEARLDGSRFTGKLFKDTPGCIAVESMYEEMTARPAAWAAQVAAFLGIPDLAEGLGPRPSPSAHALRMQRLWLDEVAAKQGTVRADENSHTAYFLPGAHLHLLSNDTLSWLYR